MKRKIFKSMVDEMSILYTADEVAKHNVENDLWIIIHNGIYNVTKFLKEHPGGEEILVNLAGSDGSDCFDAIGHSTEAIQLREMYKIGDLAGAEGSKMKEKGESGSSTEKNLIASHAHSSNNADVEEPWDYVEHEEKSSPWLPIFLGLGVLVYAIIFSYIF